MGEPVTGNKRLRSSYFSSILSISLVLFMLGLLGMLVLDARKISDYVKEHVQLNVFISDDISSQELSAMEALLRQNSAFRSVRYISKQEALDSLKKDLGPDATGMLEENPLPASFELKLNAEYTAPAMVKNLAAGLRENKMVREVTYQESEIDKMNENFRIIAGGILIFCALLLVIAVALINSTIRIAMHSRRFLIRSMQLVGATRGFIRKPFIARSIVQGFYAGIIACLLLTGLLYLIYARFPDLVRMQDLKDNAMLFGGILLFGMLLSMISTYVSVNRFLKMKAEELYG